MTRRLKRWGICVGVCALVLIVGIIALKQWSNGSSDGTVRIGKPVAQDASTVTTPLDVKTSYFTTVLPDGFMLKRQTETPEGAAIRLQLAANTKGVNDQQFAATGNTLPSNGLDDVGDYHLRTTDTATYARFSPAGLPVGATAFRNTGGAPAFVVFWPHGTRYVELAFNTDGGATYQQLEDTYAQVMDAWEWQ